jgi:outer membrane receptor protein involved in Fe transport
MIKIRFMRLHARAAVLLCVMSALASQAVRAAGLPAGDSADADEPLPSIVVTADRPDLMLLEKNHALDESRDRDLLPKFGASLFQIDAEAVDALPQGKNTTLDKVLLQAPGVSYDSAVSNPDFHVRNEYANVQYRINGIQLPDGVSGLGPVLEAGFVGNLNLLDGALPAQYGQRTAGVVDITAKTSFEPGGNLDVYGGSWDTVSPSVEFGGSSGQTQYFMTARYLQSAQGLENAMPTADPVHDRTAQSKFFGYSTTMLGDSDRLTTIAGASFGRFQIPDLVGLAPLGDFGPSTLSSTRLDENETDRLVFAVLALQSKHGSLDTLLSIYSRYASAGFTPDVYDDLVFNDVASNVIRKSLASGLQFDAADRIGDAQVLRGGLVFAVEQTRVDDLATVLPLGIDGTPLPDPLTIDDADAKRGWNFGAYLQDESRIGPDLTLNLGLRFDKLVQFVSASQLSPRAALVYKPLADTSVHAGASRYFTPPMQAQATPSRLALFQDTTQQPAIARADPVLPERADYFDVGVDTRLRQQFSVGIDAYYKRATDLLDDGQFGQAVVLEQFNHGRGFSRGVELKLNFEQGGLRAYANASHEVTEAQNLVSNQYLFTNPAEFAYLATHYAYTSDAQTVSASVGSSYRFRGLLASVDGFYGSGLRTGFANLEHVPGYTQWNLAIAREFDPWQDRRPLTLRLSAVNVFDRSYLLRSGTGIGEFAPQYGPRRGIFLGLTLGF